MLVRSLVVLVLSLASLVGATARAQDPANLGPHAVTEWDVGSVSAATLSVPTVVVYPNDVRATMPCRITTGCDHNANANAISALLDWAVAQSAMTGTVLSGRVDGTRRGLVGHSFGALNAHFAGSRDASVDSVVLIDPNDDTGLPDASRPRA